MVKALYREERAIMKRVRQTVPIRMNPPDEQAYDDAKVCYLCKTKFIDNGEHQIGAKVRDHCHFTGVYRGALHSGCNLSIRTNRRKFKIPVIFHNLKGFDGHIIVQGLKKNDKVTLIPSTMEKYISISLGSHLKLIDSLAFLPSSLRTLVESLPSEDFHCCREFFGDDLIKHAMTKQSYPYDYMDSFDRFSEDHLPHRDAFFNALTQSTISTDDYTALQTVWDVFQLRSLGDLHDHYIRCDVLQLADVWASFRRNCRRVDGLDPNHYFTLPQLAWDSALLKSGAELDLIDDVDLHQMIESGIRGGVSVVNKRFAEADNPYQKHPYDDAAYITSQSPEAEYRYLLDIDCNNLYGCAMMEPLPVGGWKWLDKCELDGFDVLSVSKKSETGYILEVDLSYPDSLHASHNDLPCAPEHFAVPNEMLSPFQHNLLFKAGLMRKPDGDVKLIPNLYPKRKYVCHYRTLQIYLELGLVLTKIHRVVQFRQASFLRSYIKMNTNMRKKSRSNFEKDFWKLRNNSVFGKTIESKRSRRKVDICTTERKFKKIVAMPSFLGMRRFQHNVVGVERHVTNVLLDRPIAVGFTVLELSKRIMWQFHHMVFKKIFPKATLCYTDTDSLLYDIPCNDVYRSLGLNATHFDLSDYHPDHAQYSDINRKRPGKFHDELSGKPLHKFCGLRSKMYALQMGNGCTKKTAKGISRNVVDKKLTFEVYYNTLINQTTTSATNLNFRSFRHNISLVETNKLGLSCMDDKRYINPDGQTTLAHGHCEIPQRIPRPKSRKHVANRRKWGKKSVRFAERAATQPTTYDEETKSNRPAELEADHNQQLDDADLNDSAYDVGDHPDDEMNDELSTGCVPTPRQKTQQSTFRSFLASLPTDRWEPPDPGFGQSSIADSESAQLLLNSTSGTDDDDVYSGRHCRRRRNPFIYEECEEATAPKKHKKPAKYVMLVRRFFIDWFTCWKPNMNITSERQ
jgi:hypothetical protein